MLYVISAGILQRVVTKLAALLRPNGKRLLLHQHFVLSVWC